MCSGSPALPQGVSTRTLTALGAGIRCELGFAYAAGDGALAALLGELGGVLLDPSPVRLALLSPREARGLQGFPSRTCFSRHAGWRRRYDHS